MNRKQTLALVAMFGVFTGVLTYAYTGDRRKQAQDAASIAKAVDGQARIEAAKHGRTVKGVIVILEK